MVGAVDRAQDRLEHALGLPVMLPNRPSLGHPGAARFDTGQGFAAGGAGPGAVPSARVGPSPACRGGHGGSRPAEGHQQRSEGTVSRPWP